MKKYSFKIKADKLQRLMAMGLSSMDIAILMDEIRKMGEAEKKLIAD